MTQHSSKEDPIKSYAERLKLAASSPRRTKIFNEFKEANQAATTIADGDFEDWREIINQARLSFSNPSKPGEEQRAAVRAYATALELSGESASVLPEDLNTLLAIEVNSSSDDAKDEARAALVAVSKASPSMMEQRYDQTRVQLSDVSKTEKTEQLIKEIGILS